MFNNYCDWKVLTDTHLPQQCLLKVRNPFEEQFAMPVDLNSHAPHLICEKAVQMDDFAEELFN